MKYLFTIFLTILTITQPSMAKEPSFADFAKQILAIKDQPTKLIESTHITVLHPLVKERETKLVHYSDLKWENGKCSRTVTDFKQLAGKPVKGETGVGKTYPFPNIGKKLKEVCNCTKITDWNKFPSKMKLDGKEYDGFKCFIELNSELRECLFYTKKNEIIALSYGFPKKRNFA